MISARSEGGSPEHIAQGSFPLQDRAPRGNPGRGEAGQGDFGLREDRVADDPQAELGFGPLVGLLQLFDLLVAGPQIGAREHQGPIGLDHALHQILHAVLELEKRPFRIDPGQHDRGDVHRDPTPLQQGLRVVHVQRRTRLGIEQSRFVVELTGNRVDSQVEIATRYGRLGDTDVQPVIIGAQSADGRLKRIERIELRPWRIDSVETVLHLNAWVKARTLLVDPRIGSRRIVDRAAAGDGRHAGQHPHHTGIGQGDANGFVQRHQPRLEFGTPFGDRGRRRNHGDRGSGQLSRIPDSDRLLLREYQ